MYKINRSSNNIDRMNVTTFAALEYRERENLQEWIVQNQEMF